MEGMRPIRVVRPRTLSACVLGRTHAQATAARTDVGRSPRAIDSRARVGDPRSHARMALSGLTSSSGRARVRLARTYLPICFAAARVLAVTGGCTAHRASLALAPFGRRHRCRVARSFPLSLSLFLSLARASPNRPDCGSWLAAACFSACDLAQTLHVQDSPAYTLFTRTSRSRIPVNSRYSSVSSRPVIHFP